MSTNITAAEVFSVSDPNHPVALVSRVGGGVYAARKPDGDLLSEKPFETFDAAVAAAESYGERFDGSPEGALAAEVFAHQSRADALREARADVVAKDAEIAALRAEKAVIEAAEPAVS